MTMKLYDSNSIQSIATAIRAKDGDSTLMTVDEMPSRIGDLPSLNNYFSFLGPDAESIALFSDSYTLKQLNYDTWTPSTTSTVLAASTQVNSQSYTLSANFNDEWNYALVEEWDFLPTYSTSSTAKVRLQRNIGTSIYDIRYNINANSIDTTTPQFSGTSNLTISGGLYVYYNSNGSRVISMGNPTYGVYMAAPSASISIVNNTFTISKINSGAIGARCSTSYLSTANAALIDANNSTFTYELSLVKFKKPNIVNYMVEGMVNIYKNPL